MGTKDSIVKRLIKNLSKQFHPWRVMIKIWCERMKALRTKVDMCGSASFQPVAILTGSFWEAASGDLPLGPVSNSQDGLALSANIISPCHFELKHQIRLDKTSIYRPDYILPCCTGSILGHFSEKENYIQKCLNLKEKKSDDSYWKAGL